MKLANNGIAFATFFLIATIVLIAPAIWLHYTIAGWSPIYIPQVILHGAIFAAPWPAWLTTAITLSAVFLAARFALRSTRLHARGKAHGLGGHPVLRVFGSGMVLLAIYVALGGAAFATEWLGLLLVFGIATLIGFFLLGIYGGLLVAAVANARFQFRPAVEAVDNDFKPSLVAGDFVGNGICMIDQENSKVFVNGTICGFDEVSSLESQSSKHLETIRVALTSGDQPVKTIGYQSAGQRDQDFQRISNALGMA